MRVPQVKPVQEAPRHRWTWGKGQNENLPLRLRRWLSSLRWIVSLANIPFSPVFATFHYGSSDFSGPSALDATPFHRTFSQTEFHVNVMLLPSRKKSIRLMQFFVTKQRRTLSLWVLVVNVAMNHAHNYERSHFKEVRSIPEIFASSSDMREKNLSFLSGFERSLALTGREKIQNRPCLFPFLSGLFSSAHFRFVSRWRENRRVEQKIRRSEI